MNMYSWLWIAWVAMFCIVEYFAIANNIPGDTLSENIWKPEREHLEANRYWVRAIRYQLVLSGRTSSGIRLVGSAFLYGLELV